MTNEIVTKYGQLIREGDIVRYNSEYWFVETIIEDLIILITVKNLEKGIKSNNIFIAEADIEKVFLTNSNNKKIEFLKKVYPLYAERLNLHHFGADKTHLTVGDFVCYTPGLYFSADYNFIGLIIKQSKFFKKSIIAFLKADGTFSGIKIVNDNEIFKIAAVSDTDADNLRSAAAKLNIQL